MGRTYGKPKSFELTPGAYEVDVKPPKLEGAAPKTLTATITASGATEVTASFS